MFRYSTDLNQAGRGIDKTASMEDNLHEKQLQGMTTLLEHILYGWKPK